MASMPAAVAQIDGDDQIEHQSWCDVEQHDAEGLPMCNGPVQAFGPDAVGWTVDDGDATRCVLITPGSGLRMDRDGIDAVVAALLVARGAM